jgi:holo-[acyl-carrier protein] synthase
MEIKPSIVIIVMLRIGHGAHTHNTHANATGTVAALQRRMRGAVSVGLDVVDVRDVETSIAHFGERYLSRVFTPSEIAYATSAGNPSTMARRLGARFAAKEATLTALCASDCGISPRSIEVVRRNDGSTDLTLSGPAFAAAHAAGAPSLALTMTHEGYLAAAVVIAHTPARRSRIWWKR